MTQLELEAGPAIGRVETDAFCEGCGYNLHMQAVLRDTRLGILVCRCPECGRYGAAGKNSAASRLWLNRFGTALLAAWVFFLLAVFGLLTAFLGGVAYGHAMDLTELQFLTVATQPSQKNYQRYIRRYVIRNTPSQDIDALQREGRERLILACVAGALGLLSGGLFSIFHWHCKDWRRLLAFLPPLVGCGFAAYFWATDPMTVWIRNWGLQQIIAYLLLELLAVAVGVLIGRPIARFVLRLLVPPKPRQHLAFLWTTDGKVAPME